MAAPETPAGRGARRDPQPARHRSPESPGRGCAVPRPCGRSRRSQGRERRVPRSILLCGEDGGSVAFIVD
ncbi:hypothetical protein ADL06_14355 [Streptomyces sp. NRRL F-6491]|nr:hypothetical protein ADL06_14355 [Streptomyces sp. NRRL F-6491]KOX36312.1 hypothetical protein ADL08_32735 [Streptomyces sp. NRRL F-6492]